MSATSTCSPISPVQHKDIRSPSLSYKRDKDHGSKWANGQRPVAGVKLNMYDELVGGTEAMREKVRPQKVWSQTGKSHANKNPKPFGNYDSSRVVHKVDALMESNDHTTSALSKSLLELLPQHANNTNSAIQIAIRESAESDVLYSFDNKGPTPGEKGRKVDLGGLVEMAEQKWVSEQTEKIVKGEYEVLDNFGEKTALPRGKGKKSPKQKREVVPMVVEEDDGFELI